MSENLVSKFAFIFNLYRYNMAPEILSYQKYDAKVRSGRGGGVSYLSFIFHITNYFFNQLALLLALQQKYAPFLSILFALSLSLLPVCLLHTHGVFIAADVHVISVYYLVHPTPRLTCGAWAPSCTSCWSGGLRSRA
jgi:hypothetical protein